MTRSNPDPTLCEELALRGARGDAEACRMLVEHLWPTWLGMVSSSRRMGRLASSEDHVRNVATKLVSKLSRHGLGLYLIWREQHPGGTFADWMRIVVANVERTYVSSYLGPRSASSEGPSQKRLLNEATASPVLQELGIRPPFTANATARAVLEFARSRLPADQLSALALWLEDRNHQEIASELGIVEDEARKLVRAAVAALRRHFGRAEEEPA